jgi:cell division protein FtsQ
VSGAKVSRDPAPSLLAYRANRMWLSPAIRRFVKVILPLGLSILVLGLWLMAPAQQKMLASWVLQVRQSIESRPEFQIRQMAVTGASPILADEIRRRVGVDFPVSWFDLDTDAISERISALDAVASARVTVELGGALRVAVTERDPAVIWRSSGGLLLLDATGHRIAFIDRRDGRSDLPLLTGEGADRDVPGALALMEALAPITERVRGLTRQGDRRWDVALDRAQIIMLPEQDPVPVLERVLAMDKALDMLNRDIAAVDMRNPARPTVRLGAAGVEYLRLTRKFEKGVASQ